MEQERAAAELADIERLVNWRLRRFKTHEEWDDIRQEGLIAAWRARQQHPELTFSRVICCAALWGALSYLRSTRSRQPCRRSEYTPAPLFVSWEEERSPGAMGSAGPEAIALLRLERAEWLAVLKPRERQVILAVFWQGKDKTAVGKELCLSRQSVAQLIERGLNRYRQAVGLPLKRVNENSYQRRRRQERERQRGGTAAALHDR